MRKTGLKKLTLLSGVFILFLTAGLITISFLLSTRPDIGTILKSRVCTSKACINEAGNIINNMNSSVDPCENFYQFSCGNYKRVPYDKLQLNQLTEMIDNLENNLIDALSQSINEKIDSDSIQKAKILFRSCMNEDLIELNSENEFRFSLNSTLDGWPLIDNKFNQTQTVFDRLVKYQKAGLNILFTVSIKQNPTLPNSQIIAIDQDNQIYDSYLFNDQKFIAAYKYFILETLKLLNPKIVDLESQVDRIFNLEKEISLIKPNVTKKRSLKSSLKFSLLNQVRQSINVEGVMLKILGLNETFIQIPGFDWDNFIKKIFSDYEKIKIANNEPVIISDLIYIKNLSLLFQSMEANTNKKRDMFNLLGWIFLRNAINFNSMSKKYKELQTIFYKTINFQTTQDNRIKICTNIVKNLMPEALGRIYIDNYFNHSYANSVVEMVENIKNEFNFILNETEWMDNISKSKAIIKSNLIENLIGYPDLIKNDCYLDNVLFKEFKFDEERFLYNIMLGLNIKYKLHNSELRKEYDRKRWIKDATEVNAFYYPQLNQIILPVGFLQNSIYDASLPKYLNYGGLGTIIGHEITHGFDDFGRKYNEIGLYIPDGLPGLWSNKTISNYINQSKCMIEQYNSYTVSQINMTVDGKKTLNENIADNGGLKEAFRAYRKWAQKNEPEPLLPGLTNFNQNQLFFIKFAQFWCESNTENASRDQLTDNHAPNQYRVIGSTSNSKYFSEIFNCKPDQKNNPSKKCEVW